MVHFAWHGATRKRMKVQQVSNFCNNSIQDTSSALRIIVTGGGNGIAVLVGAVAVVGACADMSHCFKSNHGGQGPGHQGRETLCCDCR